MKDIDNNIKKITFILLILIIINIITSTIVINEFLDIYMKNYIINLIIQIALGIICIIISKCKKTKSKIILLILVILVLFCSFFIPIAFDYESFSVKGLQPAVMPKKYEYNAFHLKINEM